MADIEKKLLEHLLILKERDEHRKKRSREYYKEYYKTHKEQMLSSTKRSNKKHKEKRNETHRIYYEKNKDKICKRQIEYNAKKRARLRAEDEARQLEALSQNSNTD